MATCVREEFVPNGRAIWQASDHMKIYLCSYCRMHVFTQYEGDALPTIRCDPDGHRLKWIGVPP